MSFEPNYPSIILSWLALIGGLFLLTAGGEFLVSGAGKLAKRLGMSSLLIGLTIVAFGTSMPELFVGQ
jgi:cation:H+ antiporter